MTVQPYNVLFLCSGNSARSILAEAILKARGQGRFAAYSAGSFPAGEVHPYAVNLLRHFELPVDGLRSKSWDEFAQPGAPELDFVFTVCDDAAGELCPVWPGQPVTAHWSVADPTRVGGRDAERALAFREAFAVLERRIALFQALPLESLDHLSLHSHLAEIGRR